MTEKNGVLTFECDKTSNNVEMDNYSQRNNELVFPDLKKYPNAQYRTSWKNMCNVTSYVMGLSYSGWIFPDGPYKQPEDNLGYFILTDKSVSDAYEKGQKAMYDIWKKSFTGKCTQAELNNLYPPNELHDYLSLGANNWLGSKASTFSTKTNFKEALWNNMVLDNLPIVISTTFGGFGHIVCVTGVQYKKEDYELIKSNPSEVSNVNPIGIIVDDPWGNASSNNFASYPAGGGGSGNDILVPWNIVVARVKPAGSGTVKWTHQFKHGMATI